MTFLKHAFSVSLLSLSLLSVATPTQALTTMTSKPIKMEQLVGKGRWTAIEIWASTCSICRQTMHNFIEIDQRLPAIDVFGISTDDQEGKQDALHFIQQNKMRFPNFLSSSAEMRSYLARHAEAFLGTPTLLLFSPQGKLVAVQPGPVTLTELRDFINAQ
ncbi:TlpA family protein disulfide reductase [Thiofilum flexile]|uniref:TlpA family protein disulfide reductase n=1 Tax=Thiofilum flexile TaxID=125627 RepID=UPI00035F6776|nr:TlpA disulfide reductase family protein [Thiofilum flexile]